MTEDIVPDQDISDMRPVPDQIPREYQGRSARRLHL